MSNIPSRWQAGHSEERPAGRYIMAVTRPPLIAPDSGIAFYSPLLRDGQMVTAGTPGAGPFWPDGKGGANGIDSAEVARLIASAVENCILVNPDNPAAVAEVVPLMYLACCKMWSCLLNGSATAPAWLHDRLVEVITAAEDGLVKWHRFDTSQGSNDERRIDTW